MAEVEHTNLKHTIESNINPQTHAGKDLVNIITALVMLLDVEQDIREASSIGQAKCCSFAEERINRRKVNICVRMIKQKLKI